MLKTRHRQTIENFFHMSKDKEIVLFGLSPSLKSIIERFERVKYICDNNSELWGSSVHKIEVCSPLRLYNEDPDNIVILITAGSQYVYAITNQIQGISEFAIFYYNVIENEFLSEISIELFDNYEEIKTVEQILTDDKSKQILREIVHRRIIGSSTEYGDLKVDGEQQYLFTPMFKKIRQNEVIVDCGSYIGDTAEKFIRFFGESVRKMYLFEALPQNLDKLYRKQQEIMENDFGWSGLTEVFPFAVSNKNSTITFCEMPMPGGSFSPEFRSSTKFKYLNPINTIDVETCLIDEMIPADDKVTLIKMDIEGAEYEALLGAKKIIKTQKPRLAISIYHNACDYWRIAQLVKQFVPEYNISIRHHKTKHIDTVLYAWVE